MAAIPARDLRNHTAEILRRVEAGEEIEVLRYNHPVAKIIRFRVGGSGYLHQRSVANSNGWDLIPPAWLRSCATFTETTDDLPR